MTFNTAMRDALRMLYGRAPDVAQTKTPLAGGVQGDIEMFDASIAKPINSPQAFTDDQGHSSTSAAGKAASATTSFSKQLGCLIKESPDAVRMTITPDIASSFAIARILRREVSMKPSWGGFVHWVCAQKNRAQADAFFEKVASGLDLQGRSDPAYVIRKRLLEASRAAAGRGESDVYLAAFAVQCWNAMRQGKARSIVRWRNQNPNEPFPRAL